VSLLDRQAQLQAEGRELLATLRGPLGDLQATGSFVSGLMAWRDLDVMLLGGPEFAPSEVLTLLAGTAGLPGLTGFDYRDERGPRSPTGERRDERFHVAMTVYAWRVDLSIWLHDPHDQVTAWHRELAARVTPEQRLTILEIKDVWHRRPEYPDEVSGLEIYTAVLEHGVRTPADFGAWLARR